MAVIDVQSHVTANCALHEIDYAAYGIHRRTLKTQLIHLIDIVTFIDIYKKEM